VRRVVALIAGGCLSAGAACSLLVDTSGLSGAGDVDAADGQVVPPPGADAGADVGLDAPNPGDGAEDAACDAPPLDTTLLGDVGHIAVGNGFACAIRSDQTVVCWGQFYRGQLGFPPDSGDPNISHSVRPLHVRGPTGVQQISAGDSHACAVDSAGHVWCWGFDNSGQLGSGEVVADGGAPDADPTPVLVHVKGGLLERVVATSSGLFHSCALVQGGLVACWGDNQAGELGIPSDEAPFSTNAVLSSIGGGGGALSVAAGNLCSCAVIGGTPGTVACAGSNAANQLGADPADSGVAVTPPLPPSAQKPAGVVSSFYFSPHTLVLDSAGNVFGTGDNSGGALGAFSSTTFKAIPGLSNGDVSAIATGPTHTCAVMRDSTLQCLGHNALGELGRGYPSSGSDNPDYVLAPGPALDAGDGTRLSGVIEVSVGWEQSCALVKNACRSDGTVYCWGWNGVGQLGDGTTINRARPTPVIAP
jgi:alpha-tubulin suppressor-like RCC1 family protein